ncbi:unnamed protein product [Aphanomyces euteiches]|uniref:Histone deacetylase domain-containing protein n=1 Tax=Aphanomyces euteiches TaxID=100861 RepID=A0A6G0X0N6_9STRA|nr:hypothetical protein Ae201684_009597 [Aphanomyces euteiches]KAH9085348.1 hypothetical protein Ae201684P_005057 [Aphanomyces euteiches]KAH9157841.1 hypothetical protein AeRB84_000313 [Aphanomyces euteiches]
MAAKQVGYVYEEIYMWHAPWPGLSEHTQPFTPWENAETKRRFHSLLAVSGLLDKLHIVRARPATVEELQLNHEPHYITSIQEKSRQPNGGDAGDWAQFSQGGYEIASLSVGGVLALVDAVMDGTVSYGYALVRPPGHHALPGIGMGFCIFNNIAIAAYYLLQKYPTTIQKIAIIDYDVHHGNGTQASFESDDRVLFISTHQDNNYPLDSGHVHETGKGKGDGYTINIPLPAGSGTGAYNATIDRIVLPALAAFKPDFILVSSGFDASYMDPLGNMMVSSECFGQMASKLKNAAIEHCNGRIAFCHEGGYNEFYVPFCGAAVIEALLDVQGETQDPLLYEVRARGYQELQPHQDQVLKQVETTSKLLRK